MTPRDTASILHEAFNSAWRRLLEAESANATEIELTNCLHQMYRLSELKKSAGPYVNASWVPRLLTIPGAAGAIWARTFDTHDVVQISELQDQYSDSYTDLYGVPCWKPSASFNSNPDGLGRDVDYEAHLANEPVAETLRAAFDGLSTLT